MSRFLAGFTPGLLPPRGPNGMVPAGPPPDRVGLPVIDPPSLCEAGPCRNYHRLETKLDAQGAVDGTGVRHTVITRACYPAAGIEVELGEEPILTCSRWTPETSASEHDRDQARASFLKGPAGKAFAAEVSAFEEAIAAEAEPATPTDEAEGTDADADHHDDDDLLDALGGDL